VAKLLPRRSPFFIKATDRRCSSCMDIPRLTLPGTKWLRDSPSASPSTYLICENTVIRVARPTEITTLTTRSEQWHWTRSRRCVILGTSSSLWVPRSRCSHRPSRVSRFPQKRQEGLSHGHSSEVDAVSRNQSGVCDKIYIVVLPFGLGPQYYLDCNLSVLYKTPRAFTVKISERQRISILRWTKRMIVRATRS